MAITSFEERTIDRLANLEKRFDQFVAQDKPGSQLFTANHIAYGGANGALKGNAKFTYSDTNNDLVFQGTQPDFAIDVTDATQFGRILFSENSTLIGTLQAIASTFGTTARRNALELVNVNATGVISFWTNTAQRVTIDKDGNVGVGATTGLAKLDVIDGYIRAREGLNVGPTAGAGVEVLSTGGVGYVQSYNRDTAAYRRLNIEGNPLQLNNGTGAGVVINGTSATRALTINAAANAYMAFTVAGVEKYVIGVETNYLTFYDASSAQHRMRLGSDANLHLQNALYIGSVSTSPSFQIHLSADSAGKPTTNTWTVTSDDKTKAAIKPFDNGLAALRAFPKPIEFEYNGEYDTPIGGVPGVGYSAQEVAKVAPKMIRVFKAKRNSRAEQEDDVLAVNSSAITQMLHNALLEVDSNVNSLAIEVNTIADVLIKLGFYKKATTTK